MRLVLPIALVLVLCLLGPQSVAGYRLAEDEAAEDVEEYQAPVDSEAKPAADADGSGDGSNHLEAMTDQDLRLALKDLGIQLPLSSVPRHQLEQLYLQNRNRVPPSEVRGELKFMICAG